MIQRPVVESPSDADTLERARRFANRAVLTIELQRRRLRSDEPEDGHFIFRRWADVQFLIVALGRLRRAGELAARVPGTRQHMMDAVASFDAALPGLKVMRDVGEHIDEYGVDSHRRHNQSVQRTSLEVGTCDRDGSFDWLGYRIESDIALEASYQLFGAIKAASNSLGVAAA